MKRTTSAMLATIVLSALLGAAAQDAEAGVRYKCTSAEKGKCPPPPAPPALPHDGLAHAAPPAPPALPAMPMIPTPPAPPEPPPLPEVPAAAHAACAGKADGARITYVLRKGETMTGICEREDGKPVFQLREYRIAD